MPLPDHIIEGTWPPKPYQDAYARYGDWDTWYRGDPDLLRYRFAGRGSLNGPERPRARPSQYMGGLVGKFSRWMWGDPPSGNENDGRLHAPLPADLATTVARLLFSELPKLTGPTTGGVDAEPETDVTDWLERLLEEDEFGTTLLHAAEANSFLGDVYLKPVIDEEILPGRSFCATVHADSALPVIRWNRLTAVTFWTCLYSDGNEYLRLLEHHGVDGGKGYIEYAVYTGNPTQLGTKADLRALSQFPGYGDLVTDELIETGGVHETKLDRLDVIRIPNDGPQRTLRQHPGGLKYLGRSDFDGSEQFFDRFDEVWTSWMRDIRLAKGRILVPDYMLQSNGPGGGASFDAEREVWMALSDLPKPTGGTTPILAQQFAIRAADHQATLDALNTQVLQHAGISQQTLGHDDGATAMTATEAQARERLSFTTRDTRITPWSTGIARYIELQMMVDKAAGFQVPDPVRPNVEFGDGVAESPEAVATTVQLLRAAEVISLETSVRMVHPDWKKDQVDAEVQKLKDEAQAALPPPGEFGNPDGPPNPGKGKPTG